jgi:hypothetical protein
MMEYFLKIFSNLSLDTLMIFNWEISLRHISENRFGTLHILLVDLVPETVQAVFCLRHTMSIKQLYFHCKS